MSVPETCLGISLGVRRLGMAVGTSQELIDWQVKAFDQTYSMKKVKKIWRAIEQTIIRYNIAVIGLKLPPPQSRTEGVVQSMKYVTDKALEIGITLFYYDIQAIENHFLTGAKRNKKNLAEQIAEKYPELKKEYFKLAKSQYHMKAFEAVGALELVIRERI